MGLCKRLWVFNSGLLVTIGQKSELSITFPGPFLDDQIKQVFNYHNYVSTLIVSVAFRLQLYTEINKRHYHCCNCIIYTSIMWSSYVHCEMYVSIRLNRFKVIQLNSLLEITIRFALFPIFYTICDCLN